MITAYDQLVPLVLDIDPLPASLPFDSNLIKLHCHLNEEQTGGPFDAMLLDSYLRSAILWAEGQMHRTIVARAHRWTIQQFPYGVFGSHGIDSIRAGYYDPYRIRLPRGKCQSVSSIQYFSNYQLVTLTGPSASPPGSDFRQDLTDEDGGTLMPAAQNSWPVADLDAPAPVKISFTAGYSTFSTIPADISTALFFYISDCYEVRGTTDINSASYADVRMNKLSPYILNRWY